MDDIEIARKYLNKAQSSKDRGIDFELSFAKYKSLLNTKRCAYTGVTFTDSGTNKRTIDRVDSNKGYINSNVKAVTLAANQFKSIIENPTVGVGLKQAKQIIKVIDNE